MFHVSPVTSDIALSLRTLRRIARSASPLFTLGRDHGDGMVAGFAIGTCVIMPRRLLNPSTLRARACGMQYMPPAISSAVPVECGSLPCGSL